MNKLDQNAPKNCIKVIRELPNNKKACLILRYHHWRRMVQALIKEQQRQR